MPLLGNRPFHQAKPLHDLKPGEKVYTIEHTKEQFRSKEYLFPVGFIMNESNMAAPITRGM